MLGTREEDCRRYADGMDILATNLMKNAKTLRRLRRRLSQNLIYEM